MISLKWGHRTVHRGRQPQRRRHEKINLKLGFPALYVCYVEGINPRFWMAAGRNADVTNK